LGIYSNCEFVALSSCCQSFFNLPVYALCKHRIINAMYLMLQLKSSKSARPPSSYRPNSSHQYLTPVELRDSTVFEADIRLGRPTRTTLVHTLNFCDNFVFCATPLLFEIMAVALETCVLRDIAFYSLQNYLIIGSNAVRMEHDSYLVNNCRVADVCVMVYLCPSTTLGTVYLNCQSESSIILVFQCSAFT
jgi:hypothetical protein